MTAQVRETGRLSLVSSSMNFDLQLTPHDMRGPEYRAEVFGSDGMAHVIDPGPVRTFKGNAQGKENGKTLPQIGAARFTIDENAIEGLIITPSENYYVEPARKYSTQANAADYVIYRESDVVANSSGACGITMSEQVNQKAEAFGVTAPGEKLQVASPAASLQELRVATEADYEYVLVAGAGVADAAAADRKILSIMNQVEGLYEVELGLTLKVTYQSAWSTPNDPYSSTNPSALLGELTDYWNANRGSVARDLVHMWTGKSLDNATIGTAYLDALCRYAGNGRAAFGLSKGVAGAQQIAITAHEIGHNLGATHPNQQVPPVSECNNTIMGSTVSNNPRLTVCQYSRDEISRYLSSDASASCLNPGTSQLSFAVASTYPVAESPKSVATGDFNGDGKQDLASANFDSDNVSVLLGADNGTLKIAVNYSVGHHPVSIAAGDLNNDGKGDLVTANLNSDNISVLLGTGNGTFQNAVNHAAGIYPLSVAVGDFNSDGKLDLAVSSDRDTETDSIYGTVGVLLGTGSGAFMPRVSYLVGVRPESVAVGDFNSDGKLDLATANFFSNSASMLIGLGNGTFQTAVNYAAHFSPSSVVVGDFNGDDKPDLAVANDGSSDVSILISTGGGTFQPAVNYPADSNPNSVAAGDFNSDGKVDLAVANRKSGNVSVLLGIGNGTFQSTVNYPAGLGPNSVAIGDFNGDGKPDFAVTNEGAASVSVLLGTGTGTFQAAALYFAGVGPTSLTVSDFDGDDKQDLAVANFDSDNISVLRGNGDGILQKAVNYSVGAGPISEAVGDLNGDGKMDLVTANLDGNNISVLMGTGTGAFLQGANYPVGSRPTAVAVGDFSGDGKPDIAVASYDDDEVSVLLGAGSGSFQAAAKYTVGSIPRSIAVGDFNGDGKLDLAVANSNSDTVSVPKGTGNSVSLLLGTGNGTFKTAVNYQTGPNSTSLALDDFNGDGKQDLAVASNDVRVLLGIGNGGFQTAIGYPAGTGPNSLAVGDFNSDGKHDLAVANTGSNSVSVLLGSGSGTFQAPTNYQAGVGPRSVAAGDFNGDGKPDIAVASYTSDDVRLLLNTSGNSVGAPVNDNFAAARVISGPTGTLAGSTVLATKEPNEPNHASNSNGTGGASIWLRWTAPSTGKFYFQTFSSSFASVLAVYTGSSLGALSSVAVSSSSVPEYVEFNATAGAVYQIAIDGVTGDTGRTVLSWNTGSLSNDNFISAREIRGSSGSVNGDNTSFTLEPGEPILPGEPGAGFSAWYRWTAPNSGRVTFFTTPCFVGNPARLLGAYTGNFLDTLNQVAVNYDGHLDFADVNICNNRALRFTVTAGTTYRIQMQSTSGRIFTLRWNYANPPPNDNFANALVIAGSYGSVVGRTIDASKEPGEPNHAGGTGGASVWYRWTAPFSGQVTFDTIGFLDIPPTKSLADSYLPALMAVYTGSSLNTLTQISAASTDNKVSFNAVAGATYQIAIDSAPDINGVYRTGSLLPLHWGPKAIGNDDFANAQVPNTNKVSFDGLLQFFSLGSNVGATKEPGEPNHQGNPGGASVWYRWTALSNGNANFVINTTCPSCTFPDGNALVAIYKGTNVSALTPVPASADRNHAFDMQVGTTYYIAVDGSAGATGTYLYNFISSATSGRNDAFAKAQVISGSTGAVAGDNSAATKETGEPDHANDRGGASVWYKWTAPSSGLYTFDTFGSNFDTLIGVYTGNAVGALSVVASSDNAGVSAQSRVTFNAIVNTTYYIAVDGKSSGADPITGVSRGRAGFILLNWSNLPPPINDNFTNAQMIQGAAGNASGRNTVASKEGGEPTHAGNPGGVSVWYRWTAPVNGRVTFTTSGSDFNSLLAVYTGNEVNALTEVVSNDDVGTFIQSAVTFNAVAGTVYYIAVDGSVGVPGSVTTFTGNLVLNWFSGPGVGNDSIAQAQVINGNSGSVAGTNAGATKEIGEPNHAGDRGGRSVWYSWTASFDGPVLFTTLGSDFDTLLAVYTGTDSNNLSPIASNDDSPYADNLEGHIVTSSLTFFATAGTTYKIAVDGSGGRSGNFALRWGPEAGISGQVAFLAGQCGIGNKVTMILSGEDSRAITFSGGGTYNFQHLRVGGNYSVRGVMEIPANCFPLFLERAQNYFPLLSSVTNGDFIDDGLRGGGSTSTIAGQVRNSQGLGVGRIGSNNITITLSGAASRTTYTLGSGSYVLPSLTPGSYTITPSCPGVGFTPAHRDYNFSANQDILGADFLVQDTYAIEGQAGDGNGAALSGVTVTLSNGIQSSTLQTDIGGYYSFNAAAGDSYTVTAAKAGITFNPTVRSLPSLSANQKNVDFIAATGSTPQWQPVVLTAQQIDQIKAWTVGGRTYVYVRPKFPDAGYRIVAWGQPTRTGNDFVVDASLEKFNGVSIQAVVTTAQIYDLGPLANGVYNFNFKTSGTLSKTLQFTVGGTAPPPNPMDDARQFVRQQYLDFLNREPDGPGWDFWTDNITKCADPARRPPAQTEAECISRQRETTSAAFFISPEFQNTGYFVLRVYRGSLGRIPYFGGSVPVDFSKDEFTRDQATVSAGIVVNNQLDAGVINANKQAFVNQFVTRVEFLATYAALNNDQYVDKLFQMTGVAPTASERSALVDGLTNNTETRASVLFKIVDGTQTVAGGDLQFQTRYGQVFYTQQFNPAFVQMEYFGYMKRDPDDAGYAFWLGKLNQFGGNFVNAEMVLAFISSPEYRSRFGQP
jgi:hypothetical protein